MTFFVCLSCPLNNHGRNTTKGKKLLRDDN